MKDGLSIETKIEKISDSNENQKKVYVVTSTNYDFSVEKIFSTRAKAEQWLSEWNRENKPHGGGGLRYDYSITENNLDDMNDKPVLGLIGHIELSGSQLRLVFDAIEEEFYNPNVVAVLDLFSWNPSLTMQFKHTNFEIAAKDLEDKREQFISNNFTFQRGDQYDAESMKLICHGRKINAHIPFSNTRENLESMIERLK
jgi:hypothetical protein